MEWAWLDQEKIHLQNERLDLETNGYSLKDVRSFLEEKYRPFSRKGAFRCDCCQEPVDMVLKDPDQGFHFRHEGGSRCIAKTNEKKYRIQKKAENLTKHQLGKRIIHTILEGQIRPHGIEVREGYYWNKKLNMIPDFILQFPSGQIWAIDYITGLKKDEAYARTIIRRKKALESQGIQSFFFIDSQWLTIHPDSSLFVHLVPAEVELSKQSLQDEQWKQGLQQAEGEIGHWRIRHHERVIGLSPYLTKHLVYMNPHERTTHVIRYIQHPLRDWHLLTTSPFTISLERSLTLDNFNIGFIDTVQDQAESLPLLIEQLRVQHQQIETEITKEKELRKQNKVIVPASASIYRGESNTSSTHPTRQPIFKIKPEDTMVGLKMRDKIQERVDQFIEMGFLQIKELQEKVMFCQHVLNVVEQGNRIPSSVRQQVIETVNELRDVAGLWNPGFEETVHQLSLAEKMKLKEKKHKIQMVFNHFVTGEAYLNSPTIDINGSFVSTWRLIVLYHARKVLSGEMNEEWLLDRLLENGVQFTQANSLVKIPVNELLKFIAKNMG